MKPKPGYKTTEFWLMIVIIAPAITALVEAIQKGETGTAAILAGINAAVGGAYAIARGMAKQAAAEAPADAKDQDNTDPGVVPGPDKES